MSLLRSAYNKHKTMHRGRERKVRGVYFKCVVCISAHICVSSGKNSITFPWDFTSVSLSTCSEQHKQELWCISCHFIYQNMQLKFKVFYIMWRYGTVSLQMGVCTACHMQAWVFAAGQDCVLDRFHTVPLIRWRYAAMCQERGGQCTTQDFKS